MKTKEMRIKCLLQVSSRTDVLGYVKVSLRTTAALIMTESELSTHALPLRAGLGGKSEGIFKLLLSPKGSFGTTVGRRRRGFFTLCTETGRTKSS